MGLSFFYLLKAERRAVLVEIEKNGGRPLHGSMKGDVPAAEVRLTRSFIDGSFAA
jgi:hypothetical protein